MRKERFVSGVGKTNVDMLYGGMPRVPLEGEEIYAASFSLQLGGGYPATLINLGRLGVPATVQTFLGKDMFSRFARDQYVLCGVEPMNLYDGESIPVTLSSAIITPRDRAFISYTNPFPITDAILEAVYTSSLGADVVLIDEQFLPIYPDLKKRGSILVYDTGWRDDMSEESMKFVLELTDWYIPNAREAMKVTGSSTPREAAQRLRRYLDVPVVKMDKDGCMLISNDKEILIPDCENIRCVDSTGAGDAFLAGFVYGLYHRASPEICAIYGNITGASCVTGVGCLTNWVHEHELLKKMEELKSRIEAFPS